MQKALERRWKKALIGLRVHPLPLITAFHFNVA
jgi:hypothetical protein